MVDRGLFCNRTLNLRAIKAIGYDMDYTLVEYRVEAFERRVFEYARERFQTMGWPVDELRFDPSMVARGLVIDTELGNVVKANRFGFVKKAMHGTQSLDFNHQRLAYAHLTVELAEPRWVFLNTLFALSEGCLYAQLVDLMDQGKLEGVRSYSELYHKVRAAVDAQHFEGRLKAEIVSDPERYVILDPDAALTLLDQRAAGKKLLLITNSDWHYTSFMMAHAYDRFLPEGMVWRDLFELVIVSARKPDFFTARNPFFEVATPEGLLKPCIEPLHSGRAYYGGSAAQVESQLGLSGDEILYVGDHMFGDVHVSKSVLRWRTALILRELEGEVAALESFRGQEQVLAARMEAKEALEAHLSQVRVDLQRIRAGYGPQPLLDERALDAQIQELRNELRALDLEITPIAKAAMELTNPRWGLLMRAGNDSCPKLPLFAGQPDQHFLALLVLACVFQFPGPLGVPLGDLHPGSFTLGQEAP
ncbi:MAG: superfamily [Holophagaceae bacterium]|nr:superfamily [Holophagaceae bacterium]